MRRSSASPRSTSAAQLDQPLLDLGAAEPVELTLQTEQLEPGLLRIERHVLERDTDPEADVLRLLGDVETRDLGLSAAR